MSLWKKRAAAPAPKSDELPLASQLTDKQSMDLLAPKTIFALIAVVPDGANGPQSEEERQEYVWALYEATNPKMCSAIKGDRHIIRAYYFESRHMRRGEILGPDHWFDAEEEFRIPDQYSSIIHFLSIEAGRIRFRLQAPGKPESRFDVAVPEGLEAQLAAGPADVTLITVFTSNEPLCVPTMWPLRPKAG